MYLSIYLNMVLNLDTLFQELCIENVEARCLYLDVEDAFQFLFFFFFFTFQSKIICKTIIPNAFTATIFGGKTKQNKI